MSHPHVRIKMCGMMQACDIVHAVSLGVDAIGIIFYDQSPRSMDISQAKLLLESLPAFVESVAVFVNPTQSWVEEVITALPIRWLQFHGDESPDFCEQFNRHYIKSIAATSAEDITKIVEMHRHASAILLDTPSASSRGGSGKVFDWRIIPAINKPLILAGGLNNENVTAAIAECTPYAVDVCSGVELSPGIKDQNKMTQFVSTVRGIK